ncbi:MAG: sulfurtransferase TusA family protein [Zoogloeaceae bacterium]|jgi:sulfite reductase (ferredoxin)|nr:sulfurtransferase TusA family protein [Zoogloeaceae bacterium]
MSGYRIPESVAEDVKGFARQHARFLAGELDSLVFKTIRVPFGIYEQRKPDTYMVRVKLAGGLITPRQLAALADIAEDYGDGRIHVTTRGGAQIHYVDKQNFVAVIDALARAGLTGRGGGGNTVRNISADPLAGIAEDEVFDVTPHAVALTEFMLAQQDSYALPRKFKIAFSSSLADRGGATFIDLGFIARIENGARGFRVFVGGGMGAHSRLGDVFCDFLPETEIFLLTQAVKAVFDARGNRKNKHAARLRFLIEENGLSTFKAWVAQKQDELRGQIAPWPWPDLPEAPEAAAEEEVPLTPEEHVWWSRFVMPQRQPGHFTAKVPLLLGDLPHEKARQLAAQLDQAGADVIRFRADQNLQLRHLSAGQLKALYPLLCDLSVLQQKAPVIGDIVVCTGAATCQLGLTMPRGALPAIEKALSAAGIDLDALGELRIHLSGCPNNCGRHTIADLGFFGKLLRQDGVPYPAYTVLSGAKIGEGVTRFARRIGDISAFHLPRFIVETLKGWLAAKEKHAQFADWLDAEGEAHLRAILQDLACVPPFEEDKNPYFDWSAKELFSLKGRGTGECSAGMYDLIEADKKALKAALREKAPDWPTIRLLAARMLLVTRGEDARDEAGVLAAFKTQFIDSGLIDAPFGALLSGAADARAADLADAVLALYDTMDNTLQFAAKADAPKPAPAQPQAVAAGGVARFKDYRGVACPMNFVKTKMDLAQLQSGEILEILLDDGAPIDNVPASVKGEGHAILAQTQEGAAWRVRIEKR